MESLDIVNRQDEVIGQASRKEVHDAALIHRASHLLVIHPNTGEVFLQRRAKTKKDFPDTWDVSVSGHVSAGETYEVCVQRECLEEIGIETNDTLQAITKIPPSVDNGFEFIMVYKMYAKGPMTVNEAEISEGRWFTVKEVETLLAANPNQFAGAFDLIWNAIL